MAAVELVGVHGAITPNVLELREDVFDGLGGPVRLHAGLAREKTRGPAEVERASRAVRHALLLAKATIDPARELAADERVDGHDRVVRLHTTLRAKVADAHLALRGARPIHQQYSRVAAPTGAGANGRGGPPDHVPKARSTLRRTLVGIDSAGDNQCGLAPESTSPDQKVRASSTVTPARAEVVPSDPWPYGWSVKTADAIARSAAAPGRRLN